MDLRRGVSLLIQLYIPASDQPIAPTDHPARGYYQCTSPTGVNVRRNTTPWHYLQNVSERDQILVASQPINSTAQANYLDPLLYISPSGEFGGLGIAPLMSDYVDWTSNLLATSVGFAGTIEGTSPTLVRLPRSTSAR